MILMTFAAMASSGRTHADDLPLGIPAPDKDIALAKEGAEPRAAVFAGGCFWCTEAVFDQLNGVTDVVSGYAGGTKETADYKKVSTGDTEHAEAIRITYDPSKITFGQLLRVFFATHDPTTMDRQGPDTGHQYRSAVFYANDEEKSVAAAYIKQLDDAKAFKAPIVTTLEPLGEFYPAEDYHQDFVERNPNQGYVRAVAMPKVLKTQKLFKEYLKPTTKPAE
jgi:peptide-methionine (S)-S-oxide reductase